MKKIDNELLITSIRDRAAIDIKTNRIGGASVLVMQDGKELYREHFTNPEMIGGAITNQTVFRLASMTKPITAVATMILVDRGMLSLDDTVEMHLGSFGDMPVHDGEGGFFTTDRRVTVRHILTHSSGIGSGQAIEYSKQRCTSAHMQDNDSYVRFLAQEPLSFVPGTRQEYSGIAAFSVLTAIIQKLSGMPYEDFLNKEIFLPLGMTDTTFLPSAEQRARMIAMHNRVDGKCTLGPTYEGCVFENVPCQNFLGGAGLISTLDDYAKFAQMLLAGGAYAGGRIISEDAVKEIARPDVPFSDTECWGLGVRAISAEGNTLPVGAFGWSGAYGTHFFMDPTNRIVGLYMKNSAYDGGSGAQTSANFERDVYAALV